MGGAVLIYIILVVPFMFDVIKIIKQIKYNIERRNIL